jgi:hypothetical protein
MQQVSLPGGVTGEEALRALGLVAGGNVRFLRLRQCRNLIPGDISITLWLGAQLPYTICAKALCEKYEKRTRDNEGNTLCPSNSTRDRVAAHTVFIHRPPPFATESEIAIEEEHAAAPSAPTAQRCELSKDGTQRILVLHQGSRGRARPLHFTSLRPWHLASSQVSQAVQFDVFCLLISL